MVIIIDMIDALSHTYDQWMNEWSDDDDDEKCKNKDLKGVNLAIFLFWLVHW